MSLFSRESEEDKRAEAEKKELDRQVREEEKRMREERKAEENRKKEEMKRQEKEKKEEEKRQKELEKKRKKDREEREKQEKEREKEKKKQEERKKKEEEKKSKEEKKANHEKKDDGKKKPKEEVKDDAKEKKPGKKRGFRLPLPHFPKPGKKREKKKDGKKSKGAKKKKPSPLPRMNLIPRPYLDWMERHLYLSGSTSNPQKVIRNLFVISAVISLVVGVFFGRYMVYVTPVAFIIVFGLVNAMMSLSVDRRGKFVDEILPDALLLLSANIRAGYIPSRALILSARKEFGPLSEAIRRAGKEIMTGASLQEGLEEIPKTIKSKDLERTIKLIIEGIRGGGKIVTLLEENAIDIRRRQAIRKEISANIMMYAIFIAFAGCLGAPGLYALSSYLTTTMAKLTPDMSGSEQVSSKVSFISMSGASVSPDFLFMFSIAAILITTIFGGLILGLINSGKEKDGLKYAPILALIALLVFFAANFMVGIMFSTMLPS